MALLYSISINNNVPLYLDLAIAYDNEIFTIRSRE
jgi:hypothetical protein